MTLWAVSILGHLYARRNADFKSPGDLGEPAAKA